MPIQLTGNLQGFEFGAYCGEKRKKKELFNVRVPAGATKVPYHPFNYRMAAAIFIRVVSRYDKVTMLYWMKPLTAPRGGKRWSPTFGPVYQACPVFKPQTDVTDDPFLFRRHLPERQREQAGEGGEGRPVAAALATRVASAWRVGRRP
ncbi:hypothetical protein AVEN_12921-1 [Araneus ventricosus]|uniref:Uncharacterized protein n=1 Tax=Araneus ventricosus TaxID=182803 RepID=A0A4Y2IVY5_ARAVE|nr:hypothetical protein AVEN_12921-1 [Araneus ventricosus]